MAIGIKRKTPRVAPTVKLRTENLVERVLGEFVYPGEHRRYTIDHAFALGDYVYATDGRRMARAIIVDRVEGEEMNCPPFLDTFSEFWSDANWEPFTLPAACELTEKHWNLDTCPFCLNRRVASGIPVDKVNFTRYGKIRTPRLRRLDYDVDDATIRDESCEHCKGMAFSGPNSVKLFGRLFDYQLLYPLRLLGVVEVAPTIDATGACFRGLGVEGIVLGMA